MAWRKPHARPRAVLVVLDDGSRTVVPVDDSSTLRVGDVTLAVEGVAEISLVDRELADLERDAFAPLPDAGRPTSEWGSA